MRTLVTGANGFIGSTLVRRLLRDGHQVRALTHRVDDRLAGLPVTCVRGDVCTPETLPPAFQDVELVFHLAARPTDWGPRALFFRINAEGTRNVIEASVAAGAKRLVLLSSLAVHRFTGHVDADESTPADQEKYAYGASKVEAERLVRAAHTSGRIQATIVRPGVVVHGPGDATTFSLMAPMFERGRWAHVRRGRSLLCYSYVDSLVDGLLLIAATPQAAGETLILTDDLKLSWAEYADTIIRAFGQRPRLSSFPVPLARVAGWSAEMLFRLVRAKNPPPITDYRTALVSRDFHFTCAKAKALLGYRPRVGFEEGIRRTVEWYRGLSASAKPA